MTYLYPFGQELRRLVQEDQTPKKVFVLGVYASAVHAKWVNDQGLVCQALAVASEPRIFWDGNPQEAQAIIDQIKIPSEVGRLVLPNQQLNGPSAKVLDEHILKPLGVDRKSTWLCDLLPESRLNPNQMKVINEKYNPLIERYGLNPVTIPVEDGVFADSKRILEISKEISASGASTLVLLGDLPIKQYLTKVMHLKFKNLSDYSKHYGYGTPFITSFRGNKIKIILLAHPRQIGSLGASSNHWAQEHHLWEERIMNNPKALKPMRSCDLCGNILQLETKKCPYCALIQQQEEPRTSVYDKPGMLFCPTCGSPLSGRTCGFCEDEVTIVDGDVIGSFYQDYISSKE